MKKIWLGIALLASFICVSIYLFTSKIIIDPKLTDEYISDQDLLEKSEIVVEVEVTRNVTHIEFSEAQFQLSEVIILSVLNDSNVEVGSTLKILETIFYNENYPLLISGGNYILFLHEYIGDVSEQTSYVISGVNLGSIIYEDGVEILNDRQLDSFEFLSKKNQGETMNLKEQIEAYYHP